MFNGNGEGVDRKAGDVYAVASIIWELWYKQVPWEGKKVHAVLLDAMNGVRPDLEGPNKATEGVETFGQPTSLLTDVWEQCWDADPEKRPVMSQVRTNTEKFLYSLNLAGDSRADVATTTTTTPKSEGTVRKISKKTVKSSKTSSMKPPSSSPPPTTTTTTTTTNTTVTAKAKKSALKSSSTAVSEPDVVVEMIDHSTSDKKPILKSDPLDKPIKSAMKKSPSSSMKPSTLTPNSNPLEPVRVPYTKMGSLNTGPALGTAL